MITDNQIREPFLFNPIKHHLGFIKDFIDRNIDIGQPDIRDLKRELRHLGTSVMDIYAGSLSVELICDQAYKSISEKNILDRESYLKWTENNDDPFHLIKMSDKSQWTFKYHDDPRRFVHFFPARNTTKTFRVKANSLKSALVYNIMIGKDLITTNNLNNARILLGLSPVKDPSEAEAIMELIEILRV